MKTRKRVIGKHCRPRSGFSIRNRIKATRPNTPKMANGLVQHIPVEESTSIQWVKVEQNDFECSDASNWKGLQTFSTVFTLQAGPFNLVLYFFTPKPRENR